MKAAIYVRTSTTEQHPENQIDDCKRFAEARGYEIEGIYIEHLSGFKQIDRPEYNKIKAKAHRGEIKAVVVWALDRWVRNRDTLLDDVITLTTNGVKLHSVKESWLEAINIEGSLGKTITEFLLGLIGSIAEMESQRKSDRVRLAYAKRSKDWGRPNIHTNKKKIVYDLRDKGLSMRQIVTETGLSVGSVHKIIMLRDITKYPINKPCSELTH